MLPPSLFSMSIDAFTRHALCIAALVASNCRMLHQLYHKEARMGYLLVPEGYYRHSLTAKQAKRYSDGFSLKQKVLLGFSGKKQITYIYENSITCCIKHSIIFNYLPTFSTSNLVYQPLFDYNTEERIERHQYYKVDKHAATTTNNTPCGC